MLSWSDVEWQGCVPLIDEEKDQQNNKGGGKASWIAKGNAELHLYQIYVLSTAGITNYIL